MKRLTKRQRERRARIAAAFDCYRACANAARVTWRMVKYWVDDERDSPKIERALNRRERARVSRVA